MQTIDNYRFNVSLSDESFPDKTISNAMIGSVRDVRNREIRKEYGYKRGISFRKMWVSSQELLDRLLHGHVFCHNFDPRPDNVRKDGSFGSTEKCDECFSYSKVIGVDIDGKTRYNTVQDYIERLSLKPTFWHTSFSHMSKGFPKFRLVYVFEEQIDNPFWFRYCSSRLIDIIKVDLGMESEGDEIDRCIDNAGLNCSQYFNGTNINTTDGVEYGITDVIYDLGDIGIDSFSDEGFKTFLIDMCGYSASQKKKHCREIKSLLKRLTDDEYTYNPKTGTMLDMTCSDMDIIGSIDLIGDFEITDINVTGYSDDTNAILYFWDRNSDKEQFKRMRVWELARQNTHYIYRLEKPIWEKDRYQIVGDDYFRLPYYHLKRTNGEHRRKTLFYRMCLRRIMSPNLNRDEMVVNTIIDIMKFFDNSDNVLNSDFIRRNVENCYTMTVQEIEEHFSPLAEHYRMTTRPVDGMIFRNKTCHSSETKYLILDDYYNENYTDGENIVYMNGVLWFNVSKSLFYKYKSARGYTSTDGRVSDSVLYDLIDANMSVRRNLAMLKERGIKCKTVRLSQILKQKKENMSKLRA